MTGEFVIATHALVFLYHKQDVVSSNELEKNICSPSPRIRKVLSKLKAAGWVETRAGNKGGYILVKNPGEITLYDCLRVLDEVAVPINWLSGDPDKECLISSGMGDIIKDIQSDLNKACEERLKRTTILDINNKIFMED